MNSLIRLFIVHSIPDAKKICHGIKGPLADQVNAVLKGDTTYTLVNVYVDLVVFTRIAGTS